MLPFPQLVTLKQRERAAILAVEQVSTLGRSTLLPVLTGAQDIEHDTALVLVEAALGIRPLTTPSTGNCMAKAVAQACLDQNLAAHNTILKATTASI